MTRLFVRVGAVLLFLLCSGISNNDSSNDDVHDSSNLLPGKDIVIDTFHDYLQGQEERLATLRKHIEDYSKDYGRAIRKVAETLMAATQGNFSNDNEIETKADINDPYEYAVADFKSLCDGEILLTADISKKLKCRYVDHGIPSLKVGPFKEEEVVLDPRIVLYHDVIYELEIEILKRLSKPKLAGATIVNNTSGKNILTGDRISKIAWIYENEDKQLKLLRRRVEHMTGLSTDSAEALQIGYYEIGGHYKLHKDFFNNVKLFHGNPGNRLATVLFYMNDVEKGGATVFPDRKVAIWPKKGSAAFWYNLKRNGVGDMSSLHGACPVISGTKWIATLWLHEKGQELRRPCTLLEDE